MNQSPRPVVILDFGAQYAQLIARRVREQHVYSVIVPCNVPLEELRKLNPQAIILSGGPASVYDPGSPSCDDRVFEMRVPILGICYGLQLMSWKLGGKVGIAPRLFLKKLVSDVLDRIDQFQDFDPSQHYQLTLSTGEMTATEREAQATSVDNIELDL